LNSIPHQFELSQKSLLLPSIFSGVSIHFFSRGVKCWVPVDESNTHSQAFCFAAEFELKSSYGSDRYLSTSPDSIELWSTNVRVFDIQMFMSRIIYQSIYSVLPSIFSASTGSICIYEEISSVEKVQDFTKKEILLPVDIDINHSVVFNSGILNPNLSQTLNILVTNVESIVYLDSQNFSDIYRNTIKPLCDNSVLLFREYQLFAGTATVLQVEQHPRNERAMEHEHIFDLIPYLL
jgi:hypothetical protein